MNGKILHFTLLSYTGIEEGDTSPMGLHQGWLCTEPKHTVWLAEFWLLNKANNNANTYNTEPLLVSFGLLIRCFPAHAGTAHVILLMEIFHLLSGVNEHKIMTLDNTYPRAWTNPSIHIGYK